MVLPWNLKQRHSIWASDFRGSLKYVQKFSDLCEFHRFIHKVYFRIRIFSLEITLVYAKKNYTFSNRKMYIFEFLVLIVFNSWKHYIVFYLLIRPYLKSKQIPSSSNLNNLRHCKKFRKWPIINVSLVFRTIRLLHRFYHNWGLRWTIHFL